jgi:hypothetical protein
MTTFSAADSALGYLYQVRTALLWSLRRMKVCSEFVVSLETLDDVAFHSKGGEPEELLQTKHHRKREGSLSNASTDLWKSLRVWFEGHANGQIPGGTTLCLLTTTEAPQAGAASFLRSEGGRNVAQAQSILEGIAGSSESQANAPAYAAFLAASASARRAILDDVVVIDRAPSVLAIDDELRKEVFWSAEKRDHDAFLKRLEGWWLRRVIKQLSTSPGIGILSAEFEAEMALLREQFKQDNLPIDEDLLTFSIDEATHAAHENHQFVRQLGLIDAGRRRVGAAIRDFYRAHQQRSRWIREELLLVGDLSRYESKLVEEWELFFDAVKDEIDATAAEEVKRKAAREVLAWAERATIAIRPGVTEPFIVRGSFHILADESPPRVWWHPDFQDRLAAILNSTSAGVSAEVAEGDAK